MRSCFQHRPELLTPATTHTLTFPANIGVFAQGSRLTAGTFTYLLRSESPQRARIGPARRLPGRSRWSEWIRRRPAREEDKRGVTSIDKQDKFAQQATALLRTAQPFS